MHLRCQPGKMPLPSRLTRNSTSGPTLGTLASTVVVPHPTRNGSNPVRRELTTSAPVVAVRPIISISTCSVRSKLHGSDCLETCSYMFQGMWMSRGCI